MVEWVCQSEQSCSNREIDPSICDSRTSSSSCAPRNCVCDACMVPRVSYDVDTSSRTSDCDIFDAALTVSVSADSPTTCDSTLRTLHPTSDFLLSPSKIRIKPTISSSIILSKHSILLFLLSISLFSSLISADDSRLHSDSVHSYGLKQHFTNQWAVEIEGGDPKEADRIAQKYGFTNLGPVFPDADFFLFEHKNTRKKSTRKTRSIPKSSIIREPKVLELEQQVAKKRVKRDFLRAERPTAIPLEDYFQRQLYAARNNIFHNSQRHYQNGYADYQDMDGLDRNLVSTRRRYSPPNDPFWKDMWYLHRSEDNAGEMDHNVKEAWELGYTGRGVVVTILDDGLERTHPDIAPNYDPMASYDVNDRDDDPTPRYEYTDENRHGTRCAGEVASIFNNSLCIVGIAFNAKIGGIRMLDGDVTDAVEAASLSHNLHHIDIYSASWGPDDDGRTVDGPATLTKIAFERGINHGRNGRGSIFIWASGNGGKDADSCNCDGYTNSIYTLSISSATERGNIPWYSEACSSTLATAYSSGATGERMIVTTDLHHSCTKSHTGTSASAPLAAGIAALTLESNPDLTWRDLQHIVVRTSKPVNLRAGDWKINGIGRNVSHSFGYGLLDAGAMVKLARVWRNVPEQKRCRTSYPAPYKTIPHGNRLHLQVYTDGCAGSPENHVKYLEHVQAIVTLNAPKRGDIQIYLTSPKGTRSTLLAKRARDTSRTGFRDWAFMTTHNWGEVAYGTWTLEIDNDDAELLKWELVMYGTDKYVGPSGYEGTSYVAARSIEPIRDSNSVSEPKSAIMSMIISLFMLYFSYRC